MADRIGAFCTIAYLIVGSFTFGHSAAAQERWEEKHCAVGSPDIGCNTAGFNGIIAGIFWPLYWSWEMQK